MFFLIFRFIVIIARKRWLLLFSPLSKGYFILTCKPCSMLFFTCLYFDVIWVLFVYFLLLHVICEQLLCFQGHFLLFLYIFLGGPFNGCFWFFCCVFFYVFLAYFHCIFHCILKGNHRSMMCIDRPEDSTHSTWTHTTPHHHHSAIFTSKVHVFMVSARYPKPIKSKNCSVFGLLV